MIYNFSFDKFTSNNRYNPYYTQNLFIFRFWMVKQKVDQGQAGKYSSFRSCWQKELQDSERWTLDKETT